MVKFLINRPIAVIMAFLAIVIIGCVTYFALPVSMLPNIDIPQITVQIKNEGVGARELENTMTTPLRRQLQQVSGLSEIKSETRDGIGIIHLQFNYGTDTDLAFIEVNEKIDAAMSMLPRDAQRPQATKASATDIPVVYLNMTLRNDDENGDFLQLAELAENVVRRRIEQMPEISMADVTGIPQRQLRITPNRDEMTSLNITIADIESALNENNVEPGAMTVRNGYYEYNINISNQLRDAESVKRIFLRKDDHLMQLGDFCQVDIVANNPQGYCYFNGKRAVTLAIIKQSEENIGQLQDALAKVTAQFEHDYPQIEFTQSRDQTALLNYTISNLIQNLILGFLLVIILTALFMGEMRSSVVIGISIVVAVIITFLVFYLFHASLNIISLSGLILAVGMMIDNSVIVTENIMQYRQQGYNVMDSCHRGTTEMITPMLSSMLTTVAVFVPLVFMSGIAGAIFYDQAFAITAGLVVSYIVGIMLLPVLYRVFFSRHTKLGQPAKISTGLERIYTSMFHFCFRQKYACLAFTILCIPACIVMFKVLPVERMPKIDHTDMIARVEWNENINLDENSRRVNALIAALDTANIAQHSAYVGVQDYLLTAGDELSTSEAEIYLQAHSTAELTNLNAQLQKTLKTDYPRASVEYKASENIFEKIFSTNEPDLEARLHTNQNTNHINIDSLLSIEHKISDDVTPLRDQISLIIDREKLLLYKINYNDVARALNTAFKANSSGTLRSYQQYIPMVIAGEDKSVERILAENMVNNVPLSYLITIRRGQDLKNITAGIDGEYIPLAFNNIDNPEQKMQQIESAAHQSHYWDVNFAGNIFTNKKMMTELTLILLISLMLMYFILCAQFGSFIQPLIVLLEIPIDTAFALLTLWLCGHTLNLMSAIGIIVTCGIVVNDSILKLDAINELRKNGIPILDAIHTAGLRRLRPIIMTSLTTIFAMVPMLFTHDMGSELQQPLAIAMIGSMVVGTLISIFIIPIIYWFIYRKHEKVNH